MSDHMTPDQFNLDLGRDNANSLTTAGNVSDNNLIRNTKANTWEENTEDNVNDHGIVSSDHDKGDTAPVDHEVDNRTVSVSKDHDNNIITKDHDNSIIPKDHDNSTIDEEHGNNTISEDYDNNTIQEDQYKNAIHEVHDNNTIEDDHDDNIISKDYDNYTISKHHDNNTIPEDRDNNTIPDDHDNDNNPKDHANKSIAEDHGNNTIPEGHASLSAYYVTDEGDFAFPFMKLFSCKGKKGKTKDKSKHQKQMNYKEREPLINPLEQMRQKLLDAKCKDGAFPNHPYFQTLSGGSVFCNSSITEESTGSLIQSGKTNSERVSADKRQAEKLLSGGDPDSYKDVPPDTSSDSDLYDFSHPHRGYAIIIVNKNFERLCPRNGAEVDVHKTRRILRKLGYLNKNIERHDLDKESTLAILQDVRDADHTEMDSFTLIISSHGNEMEHPRNGKKEHVIYCSDDQYIFTGDILEMFSDENIPSLRGKPKLFFIQACRGTNVDSGAEIGVTVDDIKQLHRDDHISRSHYDGKSTDEETTESEMKSKSESKLILGCDKSEEDTDARGFVDVSEDKPIVRCNNDCLVMYGIPSGHFAWRSNNDGSWMLHYLWEEVMKYDYRKPCSFLKVLTAVNRKMADRETYVPDSPEKNGKKAIPVIIHQLDKDIVFQLKEIKYVRCTFQRDGIN